MNNKEWRDNYKQWKEECKKELIEKGHNPEEVEVCENGQIHFLGSLVMTESNYVTSWKDSRYYLEV